MIKSTRLTCAALLGAILSPSARGQHSAVQERTRLFLDAYANGDRKTILHLMDPVSITMYGSDRAEVAHGSDAVLRLLDADQRLWGGSAHIGPMEQVSVSESKQLSIIVCDALFSVGRQPPIPVRFVAVWRREGGQWLLVLSSNAVVTQQESAEELLKGR